MKKLMDKRTEGIDYAERYFRRREEVASLFVHPSDPHGSMALAVLVKDAGLSWEELEDLREEYSVSVSALCGRPTVITVLNTAPPAMKCRIPGSWELVVEWNRAFRSWFQLQAAAEYRDSMENAA